LLEVKLDKQFKKDIKRDQNSGRYSKSDFGKLKFTMDVLIEEKILDENYLEHQLVGDWKGYSECHIKPNWLLIYKQSSTIVKFARVDTHQQLFKKF